MSVRFITHGLRYAHITYVCLLSAFQQISFYPNFQLQWQYIQFEYNNSNKAACNEKKNPPRIHIQIETRFIRDLLCVTVVGVL